MTQESIFLEGKKMIRKEIPDYPKIILKVTSFTFREHTEDGLS